MTKKLISLNLLLLAIFYQTGCLTLEESEKPDKLDQIRSSVSEELIKVKQDINTLKGQFEELQYKIDKIQQTQSQQAKEINTTLKEWRDKQKDLEKKLSNIESNLQTIEKRQAQDKRELLERTNIIAEEVGKENRELRAQIEAVRKSSITATSEGYHIVAQGDTLSKIAQMYGVSIKDLMDVNNITDPNSIKTGQKLVIPKR